MTEPAENAFSAATNGLSKLRQVTIKRDGGLHKHLVLEGTETAFITDYLSRHEADQITVDRLELQHAASGAWVEAIAGYATVYEHPDKTVERYEVVLKALVDSTVPGKDAARQEAVRRIAEARTRRPDQLLPPLLGPL